jgi:hypothetical protein
MNKARDVFQACYRELRLFSTVHTNEAWLSSAGMRRQGHPYWW